MMADVTSDLASQPGPPMTFKIAERDLQPHFVFWQMVGHGGVLNRHALVRPYEMRRYLHRSGALRALLKLI
ncbi:MAG: hypothetical protein IPH37_16840 [Burkholderiales bacterium]|nr:hypothetical protein [Burkholderiales bacterium]